MKTSIPHAFVAVLLISLPAHACTRIFWNDNGRAMLVARTMDLDQSDQARLVVYPRGLVRDGLLGGKGNSCRWTSTYGSAVITAFGLATTSGMNEKGLSADLLNLEGTQYEPRDETRPGVSALWAQYFLDNCSSVKEALAAMKDFQVVPQKVGGRDWPIHLALEDASGDSAVVEFLDGKMTVHHGRQYTVLTNEPPLEEQIGNLKNYSFLGGTLPMPGTIDPRSRFARAYYYLNSLPKPQDGLGAVAELSGVARTVTTPPGAVPIRGSHQGDSWHTLWMSVADLTNKTFYFQSASNPNTCRLEFQKLNLNQGAPILTSDAYDRSLGGEISSKLKPE
jgi:penicillin V acylase-like amidase (Ntn superfamily)